MLTQIHITYADPNDPQDTLTVDFRIADHDLAQRWAQAVQQAQALYSIDDPRRFYGFGSVEEQARDAVERINQTIAQINCYGDVDLINRQLNDVHDQDTLNYLHNIFERHHGLLDQQGDMPIGLRNCLANLNIQVHRCESVARGTHPRHVVTWFGLPKTRWLKEEDYELFTSEYDPGTIFLNYVEIGKTLEDLATDRDQYIGEDAFQPWQRFSADFVVRYSGSTAEEAEARSTLALQYYQQHRDRFGPWQDRFRIGSPPVAYIEQDINLVDIARRQCVQSVKLT